MTDTKSGKFAEVDVDPDTRVLFERELKVLEKDALLQGWLWDGLKGVSMIFVTSEMATTEDSELRTALTEAEIVPADTEVIIKRGEKYTFANWVPSEGE